MDRSQGIGIPDTCILELLPYFSDFVYARVNVHLDLIVLFLWLSNIHNHKRKDHFSIHSQIVIITNTHINNTVVRTQRSFFRERIDDFEQLQFMVILPTISSENSNLVSFALVPVDAEFNGWATIFVICRPTNYTRGATPVKLWLFATSAFYRPSKSIAHLNWIEGWSRTGEVLWPLADPISWDIRLTVRSWQSQKTISIWTIPLQGLVSSRTTLGPVP